jgi:hypothetical protein
MRISLIFLLFTLFFGCGYKPSSIYTKEILGKGVFVDIFIDNKEPENAVLIKDAINEAVVNRMRSRVVSSKEASSKLYVKLKSISFIPIQYNRDGYIVRYRVKTKLSIDYSLSNSKSGNMEVFGDYDFIIEPNSSISDAKRFEAIKISSYKALDDFVSRIAIVGKKE